jgi:2,5-diketo-D-gluconate reductase A
VSSVPTIAMNDGRSIPQLGFGVFQIDPQETTEAVTTALDCGYRLIDTAQGYSNEKGVGQAVAAGHIDRADLFITTKLTNSEHGRDKALTAFDASLQALGLDYVDLFLIHWPLPQVDLYVQTWRAFAELRETGRARSIGVSNFTVEYLQRLIDETGVVPVLNQIELHPFFPQPELRQFHSEHDILTEAWAPIGQGHGLLDRPVLAEIAARHGKTPAQVVLRWHVQLGNVVIPKSVTPANIDVFDFALTDDDMAHIAGLQTGERIGPNPADFNQL